MYPVLFELGPIKIYSFGVMTAIGFLVSTLWFLKRCKQKGDDPDLFFNLALGLFISGIIGARLFYVLQHLDWYQRRPLEIFLIQGGGLVAHGGVLLALLFGAAFTRWKKISFWKAADLVVPFWALGHAFGRIGCFLNGCCYGSPSTLPFALRVPGTPLRIHPVQLYESLGLFVLFGGLLVADRLRLKEGGVFGLYLAGYGLLRFWTEFVRGDQERFLLGMTLPQWMSLAFLWVGLFLVISRKQ